jgi:pimeloyl-ACP methyl ester carboxylesterase
MIDDTLAAHELLLDAYPGQPVHWFGLALGANIALRAAARARVPPAHLVLWEPVLDGAAYLAALLEAHRSELARELGYSWAQLVRSGRETEPALPGEVLGFEYGAQLVEEIRALGPLPLAAAARRGTAVTCVVGADQVAAVDALLARAQTPRVAIKAAETLVNWKSTEALGSAIAPRDVAQTVLATLDLPPATVEGLFA